MKIRVECYAGYPGEEEPRAFTLGETRIGVVEILDRWMSQVGSQRPAPSGAKTLH